MKNHFYAPILAASAVFILAACEDETLMPLPPSPPPQVGTRYEETSPSTSTHTETTTTTTETTPTPPPPPVEAAGPLQVGKPVAGRPGFVTSPHSSDPNAIIDVRGMPPGMEVMDPYTKKSFLVP